MKKLLSFSLLAVVACALAGVPAQAESSSQPGTSLVKHKHHKHKKHHHKHKQA